MQNSFVYTVTQVNNYSSELLKKKLSNIWVEGEISSLKIYPSGYAYFILKDLKSELSCLTFARKIDNIYDGMKITVNGNIDLYTIKGKYQLKVSSIFTQGEGELWKEYVLLKTTLEKVPVEGFIFISVPVVSVFPVTFSFPLGKPSA